MRGVILWVLIAASASLFVFIRWPAPGWLTADFASLLPASSSNPWILRANSEAGAAYERQVVWLVSGGEASAAREFVTHIRETLSASGFADDGFEAQQAQRWRALSGALYPHRFGLLEAADAQMLAAQPEGYFQQLQRLLYSPLGGQALAALDTDPSGLFGRYLRGAAPTAPALHINSSAAPQHSEFAASAIAAERMGFNALAGLYDLYRTLQADAASQGLQLYATGAPLYAAYGVHSARLEMSTIGVVSVLLLVLLLLWALRSSAAVVLTLLCVSSGVAGGFLATVAVFQQMHILTLVFGASLIGIAADYALHYFAHSLLPTWSAQRSLAPVFKGLLFGMLSSVVAFTALVVLPFPGIRQIGLFMASGLFASFITVCLLFPALYRRRSAPPSLPFFCRRTPWSWERYRIVMLIFVLGVFLILLFMPRTDDVRDFYAAPSDLVLAQQELDKRLSAPADSRYLLLQAQSEQALLQVEEQLLSDLQVLQEQKHLDGFSGVSQLVPSYERQRDSLRLQREIAAGDSLAAHMRSLGFEAADVEAQLQAPAQEYKLLQLEQLAKLQLPIGIAGFLGCNNGECASWVRVSGVRSADAIAKVADKFAQVEWVNPLADINAGIASYRNAVAGMLLAAIAVTLAFLSMVMGWRSALHTLLLPLSTCLGALLIYGAIHGSYSIINLMALLLVLGVSLDYAIFRAFTQPKEQSATTLAITLSAITSVLAFGMLSFSSTPVISSFGQTIVIGLALAYGLSWIRFGKAGKDEAL